MSHKQNESPGGHKTRSSFFRKRKLFLKTTTSENKLFMRKFNIKNAFVHISAKDEYIAVQSAYNNSKNNYCTLKKFCGMPKQKTANIEAKHCRKGNSEHKFEIIFTSKAKAESAFMKKYQLKPTFILNECKKMHISFDEYMASYIRTQEKKVIEKPNTELYPTTHTSLMKRKMSNLLPSEKELHPISERKKRENHPRKSSVKEQFRQRKSMQSTHTQMLPTNVGSYNKKNEATFLSHPLFVSGENKKKFQQQMEMLSTRLGEENKTHVGVRAEVSDSSEGEIVVVHPRASENDNDITSNRESFMNKGYGLNSASILNKSTKMHVAFDICAQEKKVIEKPNTELYQTTHTSSTKRKVSNILPSKEEFHPISKRRRHNQPQNSVKEGQFLQRKSMPTTHTEMQPASLEEHKKSVIQPQMEMLPTSLGEKIKTHVGVCAELSDSSDCEIVVVHPVVSENDSNIKSMCDRESFMKKYGLSSAFILNECKKMHITFDDYMASYIRAQKKKVMKKANTELYHTACTSLTKIKMSNSVPLEEELHPISERRKGENRPRKSVLSKEQFLPQRKSKQTYTEMLPTNKKKNKKKMEATFLHPFSVYDENKKKIHLGKFLNSVDKIQPQAEMLSTSLEEETEIPVDVYVKKNPITGELSHSSEDEIVVVRSGESDSDIKSMCDHVSSEVKIPSTKVYGNVENGCFSLKKLEQVSSLSSTLNHDRSSKDHLSGSTKNGSFFSLPNGGLIFSLPNRVQSQPPTEREQSSTGREPKLSQISMVFGLR